MVSYNWGLYLNKQPTPGQLLPYPLNVMPNGELKYLDGVSNFPDFPSSAKVMGKTNPLMPQKVTTWKKKWLRCLSMQIYNFIQIQYQREFSFLCHLLMYYITALCNKNDSTYYILLFLLSFLLHQMLLIIIKLSFGVSLHMNNHLFNIKLFLYKFM